MILFPTLIYFCYQENNYLEGPFTVDRVIDGDTIVINGSSIRLIGIDTNEIGEPCAQEAKSRLEELVLGKEIYLIPDLEDTDKYNRKLRYIIVNNQNINIQLVKEGLARAMLYPNTQKYRQEIIDAEKTDNGCIWDILPPNNVQEINICNAEDFINQQVKITGTIKNIDEKDNIYLTIYNKCEIQAVIFHFDKHRFENLDKLQRTTIVGKIELYNQEPIIKLMSPKQLLNT